MLKFLFVLVLNIGIFQYIETTCNECNKGNGVACISKNEFHICVEGVPDTTKTFTCLQPNHVCSKFGSVCVNAYSRALLAACGDTSNCGKCNGEKDNGKYTCTSRTTFTMCLDNGLSDIRITCPANQMCDIGLAKQGITPCVSDCNERKIKFCDLKIAIDEPVIITQAQAGNYNTSTTTELPTTTTTIVSTTIIFSPTPPNVTTTTTSELPTTTTTMKPTTTENPANLVCSQHGKVGRYPYPNDDTCKNYIYCFMKGGQIHTSFLKCPDKMYFNPSKSLCVKDKPVGCI